MAWRLKLVVGFVLSFSVLTFARPKFEITTLNIAGKIINVEVAKNDEQRSYGLMKKDRLEKNEGMLFIFDKEEPRSFWMKNTFIDLSIAFFNKDKKIIDILDMPASTMIQQQFPSYESSKPAMYALEMNKGWFKNNNVKLGDSFKFRDQ